MSRTRFGLLLATALLGAALAPPAMAQHHDHDHDHAAHEVKGSTRAAVAVEHPDPRPGITAGKVLRASRFSKARARQAYERAREIPQVLDGIYCHCDCRDHRGMRSLLSCYESDMAASCGICMGEAELAHRLHQEGKSLQEIRTAIDARYGP